MKGVAFEIRYTLRGEVIVKFPAANGLEKADASNILDHAILRVAKEYLDLDKQRLAQKLVGFGSDGASFMTGQVSGVSARLKKV